MYCSLCGKGKHSTAECSLRTTKYQSSAIPSIAPIYSEKIYYMAHTNAGYIAYLEKQSIEYTGSIDKNRALVEKTLLDAGYVLRNPIEKKI